MDEKRSFWLTTPGILSGVAAVITAVSSLLVALGATGVIGDGEGEVGPSPAVTQRVIQPIDFLAEADAYVDNSRPSENLGSDTTLRFGGEPTQRSFVRFDVQGLTEDVHLAELWFVCVSEMMGGAPVGGSVWTTSDSWTEKEVTWENRPHVRQKVTSVSSAVNCPDDRVITYDVTHAVTGNGTYDFVLVTNSTDGLVFYSREGASGQVRTPLLVINPPEPSD